MSLLTQQKFITLAEFSPHGGKKILHNLIPLEEGYCIGEKLEIQDNSRRRRRELLSRHKGSHEM